MKNIDTLKKFLNIFLISLSIILGNFLGDYFLKNILDNRIAILLSTIISSSIPLFTLFLLSIFSTKLNKEYFNFTYPNINIISLSIGIPLACIVSVLLFAGDLHIHVLEIKEIMMILVKQFLWFGFINGIIVEIIRAYSIQMIHSNKNIFHSVISTLIISVLFTFISIILNLSIAQNTLFIATEFFISLTMTCITLYSKEFFTASLSHCFLRFFIHNGLVHIGQYHADQYILSYQFTYNHQLLFGINGVIHPSIILLCSILFLLGYTLFINFYHNYKNKDI